MAEVVIVMNYQVGAATTIDKNSRCQPLNKDKRLVRFLRLLHDERSSIACELAVFSLDDQPEYLALSYCWTKADPIYEVQLNGRPFYMKPNLYAYLELMRSEQQSGWIFIDALCINQSDIEERSSQVALKGDVYREAVGVVVWLWVRRWGKRKGSEGVETAENLMQQLLDYDATTAAIFDDTVSGIQEALSDAFLMAFVRCEYWSRARIVQELLLAWSLRFRYRTLDVGTDSFNAMSIYGLRTIEQKFSAEQRPAWKNSMQASALRKSGFGLEFHTLP